ncbi:BLOC-3 complex member HPS1-like isoform X2 [Antedon mediterranea]|uniref:BLOC-3 complex member HPS1-like isoform X2 n=1 Tax=Antedon mediterranea TaxID=105859 RepID=UPI003AF76106
MKCVIVLMNSGIPDIVFMSADASFIQHANEVAIDKGLIQRNDVSWEKLDLNIATQFFSPIVASHSLLACELNNGYSFITCENDSIFVFKDFGDHLYIAFNGDGEESEDFLCRKLMIFNKIVCLHYGPVVDDLRPDSIAKREEKWVTLGSVLNTWLQLYNQEQCFLFEAIERLQVNQGVNEMCINLLELTLKKMGSNGEKNAMHTMLLVNAKLLALFSTPKAKELQPSDILLLTLLACDIYPSIETLDDMLSHPFKAVDDQSCDTPELLSNECMMENRRQTSSTANSGDASGDGEDFHTPNSSNSPANTPERCCTPVEEEMTLPEITLPSDIPTIMEPINHNSQQSPSKDVNVDQDISDSEDNVATDVVDPCTHHVRYHIPKSLDIHGRDTYYSDDDTVPEEVQPTFQENPIFTFATLKPTKPRQFPRNEKLRIPVFLRSHSCEYTPHIAQFIPILPGITMVILSEVKSKLAEYLCKALDSLEPLDHDKVERQTRVTLKRAVDGIDMYIKKIRELLQKSRGVLLRHFNSLNACWDNCRKFGLFQYSDSGIPEPMTPRLESAVSELKRILRTIFRLKYLSPKHSGPLYEKTLDSVQKHTANHLCLYQQYLTVKAQRNITMTTYLEKFPGLIHFVYIDRTADLITAPAVNVTKTEGSDGRDASLLIHDKVWSMTGKLHRFIKEGYISVAYREGDFFYSYFLWFEDTSGSSLECRVIPTIDINGPPPGIIATDFYKNLVQSCFPSLTPGLVQCYELMCIHLAVVPIQFVLAQSQKLALWLWETGDIQKPISLL